MVLFQLKFLTIAGLLTSLTEGFAPSAPTTSLHRHHSNSASALFVGPEHLESVQSLATATATGNALDSSDLIVSLLTGEKLGELAKSIVIVLLFGGG